MAASRVRAKSCLSWGLSSQSPSPLPDTKQQPWTPDRDCIDERQHDVTTRAPGAHDEPVGCKIKLLFLEAICVLRKRINKLTQGVKKCTQTETVFDSFRLTVKKTSFVN